MLKIKLDFSYDPNEFGDWICPVCKLRNSDPNIIRRTVCGNCESTILLGPAEDGVRSAVQETYKLTNGRKPV